MGGKHKQGNRTKNNARVSPTGLKYCVPSRVQPIQKCCGRYSRKDFRQPTTVTHKLCLYDDVQGFEEWGECFDSRELLRLYAFCIYPSSSSHSAELLGNTIPTFFGFSSIKDGVPAVSGLPVENASFSINSDFQIMFKQMNKKDPTTRFKALQMFADLCENSDVNTVKAILPLWPRMYCTLCTDIDHKVREAAHVAHHAIISKVKKMIAPYLKELAGPWFTSQYDTYAPAASAATLAFEEAFPSTKLNKAIMFCQKEILSYIYDNLVNQTPQTLSNPNTTSPEDMQAKYERIVVASLQGYSLYLQKLSPDQISEAEESNKKLLSSPKFWKYSKNKVPIVRSCFFYTLISLCQNAKFLLQEESSRLSSAIFNSLDESDPVVLHAVWDAALNVLVSMENCWSHFNIEKQVFPKLCVILKNGGRNVSTTYPNILPLLSKLPRDMIRDKQVFFDSLFDNMRCGLEIDSYNQASSEVKIIAKTFIECLKYVVMKNSSEVEFCDNLVAKQLIPALKQKLCSTKVKKSQATPFLTQTSCLLHYWYSNRDGNPAYETLVINFFASLYTAFCEQLVPENTRNSLCDVLNNQMDFVCILQNPSRFLPRNKGRVKFEEDRECEGAAVAEEPPDVEFEREMLPFVRKLAVVYFKRAIEEEEKSYIPAISKIVELFDPKSIFEEMVIAVDESTCFKLFTTYFSRWLMNPDMKCEELVDLSFSLLKHVAADEKEYILEEFCNNWFGDTLQFSICKALPRYSEDECVINWVRSDRFATSMLQVVERFIEGDGSDRTLRDVIITLLKAKCANGDFIINSTIAGRIMDIVSRSLAKEEVKPHVIELSQDLIAHATTEQIGASSVEALLASLFKLWCYQEDDNLEEACKIGLRIVSSNGEKRKTGFEFTKKLSEIIGEIINSNQIEFLPERILANVNTYIDLAVNTNLSDSCSSNEEIAKAMHLVKMFLGGKPDWCEEGRKMLEKCCRVGFEGAGGLHLEYLQMTEYLRVNPHESATFEWGKYPKLDMDVVRRYAKWNLYLGGILNLTAGAHPRNYKTSALSHEPRAYELDIKEESIANEGDVIPMKISKEEESKLRGDLEVIKSVFHEPEYEEENTMAALLNEIVEFLLGVGLLESFNKFYASTKYYKELKCPTEKLKSLACDLLKNVNLVEFKFIYDHCRVHIRRRSLWWLVESTFVEIFNRKFLTDGNLNVGEVSFEELKNTEIKKQPLHWGNYLRILGYVEGGFSHRIGEEQWNDIFVYADNFLEEFLKKLEFTEANMLTLSAVARLYLRLGKSFRDNHTQPTELRIAPETCLAWNRVVEEEMYNKFFGAWRKMVADSRDVVDFPPEWLMALQNVSNVVVSGISLRKSKNPQESVELETECGRLMTSPHAAIQITAFRLCLSVIPDLVKLDTEMFGNQVTQMFQDTKDSSSLFKKSSNGEWTAKNLTEDILHNQAIVETLLSDFIIGDCCTVEPFTDSFTYTCSYLLLWCFLLEMCGEAHSPLRFQYGCWLQDAGYSNTFLESVFKLMPQTVLHGSEAKENCRKYFESYGSLDFEEPVRSERIEQIACFAYRLFLQRLPNVIREWWNQVENKTSGLVDKVTTLYVSPILISNELKNAQQDRETRFDNMEIKTYPNSREVVATYTIDEVKMDLIMALPQNFPLGTIKIDSSNVLISTSNWRNWLFQVSKYLIHQNGTIWDALVIWKNNLDKKFEGVEECYICFSILQGSSFEIPRLCCHTCKKKFHSNCLYKWFSTSNKSTCPICRNLF